MSKELEKKISSVLTGLAKAFDDELENETEEDLEKSWFFKFDETAKPHVNLYNFYDMLKLYGSHCRRWEEKHNGSMCVVERVRDKYLLPKIKEFAEQSGMTS
ncbi:hypothetical protein [Lentilitoribacter sp. Alg239-R112]|uniref:hypothetical protein n=1 Tax=Lentilitoribacter sp. Alg239-R112 TaxID=2305987 RepID=UPI0013A6BB02|nr:hypothetical protein [Lentilitoribacter sp. Alg239-R112]